MMYRRLFILSCAFMLAFTSCSVKEQRMDCPCWLQIKIDTAQLKKTSGNIDLQFVAFNEENNSVVLNNHGERDITLGHSTDGYLALSDADVYSRVRDFDPAWTQEFVIKRGYIEMCSLMGLKNGAVLGRRYYYQKSYLDPSIPDSLKIEAADSSFLHYSRNVSCVDEFGHDTLKLYKEFARVTLTIIRADSTGGYKYRPVIKSDSYALTMSDYLDVQTGDFERINKDTTVREEFTPFKAAFTYMPDYQKRSNVYHFNLPRQKEGNNIRIELLENYCENPFVTDTSLFVKGRNIGWMILNQGYDWTAPNLDDIELEVDFSLLNIEVSITPWEERKIESEEEGEEGEYII